jgi:hypothetical protein
MGRRFSTEQSDEPAKRLSPRRYALGLLTPKKDGCTMTMLLARGVEVETIDELLAAGLAIKKSELVGRGRPIEITRIAITHDGRRALAQPRDVGLVVVPDQYAAHSMA